MHRCLIGLAVACSLFCGIGARAQGCSQCRDTVTQTNPGVQQSYRLAIGIMLAAAVSISAAGFVVLRRMR